MRKAPRSPQRLARTALLALAVTAALIAVTAFPAPALAEENGCLPAASAMFTAMPVDTVGEAAPAFGSPAPLFTADRPGTCSANDQCAGGDYCSKLFGECTKSGRCSTKPTECAERGRLIVKQVCGCDGKTYDNACLAAAAGVSVERAGSCEGK